MNNETFDEWAIVELMGHRKIAGRVTETALAGGAFVRVDVHGNDKHFLTQYYQPGAVYCITPADEQICRDFTDHNRAQAPVHVYELPVAPSPMEQEQGEDEDVLDCQDVGHLDAVDDRCPRCNAVLYAAVCVDVGTGEVLKIYEAPKAKPLIDETTVGHVAVCAIHGFEQCLECDFGLPFLKGMARPGWARSGLVRHGGVGHGRVHSKAIPSG